MKTACIYHSIDLDGWMSAAIVRHWFEIELKKAFDYAITQSEEFQSNWRSGTIDFIGYNYGQPIPDLSKYDRVIMCDISFPKEEMINLYENKDLIWLDHHISAINESKHSAVILSYDDANGIRDTKFAACELTWKYFFSNPIDKYGELEEQNPMPEIVRLLGLYDSFRHKGTDEETKVLEFQYGARAYIKNYENAYEYLLKTIGDDLNSKMALEFIHVAGKSIYQYLCTEAKQVYKNGFKIKLFEPQEIISDNGSYDSILRKFICINKERFNSINFGINYHKDGYDGCACFHYDGVAKVWRFSLYNDNGLVDCSVIAKQFGGGGHKGAAGFIVNDINQFITSNKV